MSQGKRRKKVYVHKKRLNRESVKGEIEYLHPVKGGQSHSGGGAISSAEKDKVRKYIERGSSKTALNNAKSLHKRHNCAESEELLIEAYFARIDGLVEKKMFAEARALTMLLDNRYPSARARGGKIQVVLAVKNGDISSIAGRINDPDTPKEELADIEEIIRKELTYLSALASCEAIAADNGLRNAAVALNRAFKVVTSGHIEVDELALTEVSRRSPLCDWKHLIRAIAAFYGRQDDRCKDILSRIRKDSAVYGLAEPLLQMTGTEAREDIGYKGAALVKMVSGRDSQIKKSLEELDRAFESGNRSRQLRAIKSSAKACSDSSGSFIKRFRQMVSVKSFTALTDPWKVVKAMGDHSVHDADWWRLYAQANENSPIYCCAAWNQFYKHAVYEGLMQEDGIEAAILFEHMADMLCRMDEYELAEERYSFEYEFNGFGFLYAGQKEDIASVMVSGVGIEDYLYLYPDFLYEKSVSIRPDSGVYRKWLKYNLDLEESAKEADKLARRWHTDLPNEIEPVLYLAESAEKRGAFTKALKFLQQAEALNGLDPKVKKARIRLVLNKYFRHLRERKSHLAEKDINELSSCGTIDENDLSLILAALRWAKAVCEKQDKRAAELEKEIADKMDTDAGAKFILFNIAYLSGVRGYDEKVVSRNLKTGGLSEAAGRGCRLALKTGVDFEIPPGWVKKLLKELNRKNFILDPELLICLCETAYKSCDDEIAYAGAGAGLRMRTKNSARFLKIRAQSIPDYCRHRRTECFAAAAELARCERDMELVSEIIDEMRRSTFGFGFGFGPAYTRDMSMSREAVDDILEAESKDMKYPKDIYDDYDYPEDGYDDDCQCPACRRRRELEARGKAGTSGKNRKRRKNSSDLTGFLFEDMAEEDIDDDYEDDLFDEDIDDDSDFFDEDLNDVFDFDIDNMPGNEEMSDQEKDILKTLIKLSKLNGGKPLKGPEDIERIIIEHPEMEFDIIKIMAMIAGKDPSFANIADFFDAGSGEKPKRSRKKRKGRR